MIRAILAIDGLEIARRDEFVLGGVEMQGRKDQIVKDSFRKEVLAAVEGTELPFLIFTLRDDSDFTPKAVPAYNVNKEGFQILNCISYKRVLRLQVNFVIGRN